MTIAPRHAKRFPTRPPRTPDAGAAVSQNGSNVRFTPIPDEEFDDGDIEVTPELLKEPSLYPALSLIQPIKETIRVTSSFGPRQASRQTQAAHGTRAW